MKIRGKVIPGKGWASGFLKIQLPMISAEFPEIGHCHPGTLNLQLETNLLVLAPDYRTKPINWHPALASGEVFDFLRIKLEAPEGSALIAAWLYIAHTSPHRAMFCVHEVLAPKITAPVGMPCAIHVERAVLPYGQGPLVVVL